MTGQSLLGPSGSPMAELGGAKAWRLRQFGDIICSFQWLDLRPYGFDEEKGPEPCMVLFHATRRMETGAKVYRQRDAHVYVESNGDPSKVLLVSSFDAASTLGFDRNDREAIKKIITIVIEGIPDLLDMPSDPPLAAQDKRRIEGIETHIRIGGKTVHSELR